MSGQLSIPHEHGAGLTALGAAVTAVLVAPAPLPALGVGLAVVSTFFARGPVEKLAVHAKLRHWDRPALALFGALVILGSALAGGRALLWTVVTGALCAAMIAGSAWVRRTRVHRRVIFECLGLAGLGATAGLGALAAGAAPDVSVGLALVLATHAAVAVPLVRSEVRRRERAQAGRSLVIAMAAVSIAALVLVIVGPRALALALVPRAVHLVERAVRRPPPASPARVGIRETVLLALCVGIAVLSS